MIDYEDKTLDQLIDLCGKDFHSLDRWGGWRAVSLPVVDKKRNSMGIKVGEAETRKGAVIALLEKLNK